MDFRLDFGPWETIFTGTAYQHEVEIAVNPDHFYVVLIYDKREGKIHGAVVEGYKAFLAKGPMEAFLQTMPKTCYGIEKNFGDRTSKIFFLSFDPFYADFKIEDFERKIDNAIRKTEDNAAIIQDLARASSVELKEIASMPKTEYAAVLGDPLSMMGMVLGKKENPLTKIDFEQTEQEEKIPLLQLGLSKSREIIKEPSKNLYLSQITGEPTGQYYSAYIMAENMLLENQPVIIIDEENYFAQLGAVSNHYTELREELVDFEPMAFPIKQLNAKEGIFISIRNADFVFLFELIGLKDDEFAKTISLFSFFVKANTPEEFIKKVYETKELTEFEKLRAERIIKIISLSFPKLFGETIPTEELTKTIPGKLGRAVIINTKKLNLDEKAVFADTLMRQLTKAASSEKKINAVFFLLNADEIINKNPQRIANTITRLENRGIGVVIGSKKEISEDVARTMLSKISIIREKDIALSIKGKRNYRLTLRPSLSGNPKTKNKG